MTPNDQEALRATVHEALLAVCTLRQDKEDAQGPLQVLRAALNTLLREPLPSRRALEGLAGFSASAIRHHAAYALAAFADEVLATTPARQALASKSTPLQVEYFGSHNGGVAFFHKLQELREHGAAAHEGLRVYYMCLALGFAGHYRVGGLAKRRALIDSLLGELAASDPVTMAAKAIKATTPRQAENSAAEAPTTAGPLEAVQEHRGRRSRNSKTKLLTAKLRHALWTGRFWLWAAGCVLILYGALAHHHATHVNEAVAQLRDNRWDRRDTHRSVAQPTQNAPLAPEPSRKTAVPVGGGALARSYHASHGK